MRNPVTNTTTKLLSTLAVLAVTADAAAAEFLNTATRKASALSANRTAADDLVGDVALRFFAKPRTVHRDGKLKPYVDASVRNAWRDEARRRHRHPTTPFTDLRTDDVSALPDPASPVSENAQSVAVINEFRAALSAADQEVLDHLEAGRSDREIAKQLDRTRHEIRSAVARIRRQATQSLCDDAPGALGGSAPD